MSILSSIAGNKTILKVALNQITGSMERDGITAIVIVRDPNSHDEESAGLGVKTYKEAIGILEGADLQDYLNYREARENGWRGLKKIIEDSEREEARLKDEREALDHV